MSAKFVRWLPLVLVLSLPLLLIAGEIRYAHSVEPIGVRTIGDHLRRFGNPKFITHVQRTGDPAVYYEVSGFPEGRPPRLAFPSSMPAYVYDGSGVLIDWCYDPGDTDHWNKIWKRVSKPHFDVEPTIKQLGG
jgi:hypothetical protein